MHSQSHYYLLKIHQWILGWQTCDQRLCMTLCFCTPARLASSQDLEPSTHFPATRLLRQVFWVLSACSATHPTPLFNYISSYPSELSSSIASLGKCPLTFWLCHICNVPLFVWLSDWYLSFLVNFKFHGNWQHFDFCSFLYSQCLKFCLTHNSHSVPFVDGIIHF